MYRRSTSTVDTLVDNVMRELEDEFGADAGAAGAEFGDEDPDRNFFKWVRFKPVMGVVGWTKDTEEAVPRLMTSSEARQKGEEIMARWAKSVPKSMQRIAIQRCILDGTTWKHSLGGCREIDLATGKRDACGTPSPPRDCK